MSSDYNHHQERRPNLSTQAIRAFKTRLGAAKRRTRFIYGREAAAFASELRAALFDLKEGLDDPRKGVELVADFFRSDEKLFNMCDDSNGDLGDVFKFDARDLFTDYATACDDKKWLADLVLQLQHGSDYGVRDCLIDAAAQYLPEPVMRDLVEQLWVLARTEKEEYHQRGWFHFIESLARQLHDPGLYEQARRASWPKLGTAAYIDIAEAYFESGDAETALTWLKKISLGEHFEADKRDKLLLAVYQTLGEKQPATETAWRIFQSCRMEETFEQLLGVIGPEYRQAVLDDEAKYILDSHGLSYTDAGFLLWCGKLEEAERYLLNRTEEINGGQYYAILPLAEAMEREERFLTATMLYRALLESILARAISKYYTHGVRYLRKLDALAPLVENWRDFTPHKTYFLQLLEKHQRKSGFWERSETRQGKRRSARQDKGKDGE